MDYIERAEITGEIVDLDLHSLSTAIGMLSTYPRLTLSVNVSPVSIERCGDTYLELLHQFDHQTNKRLIVEITESKPLVSG